MRKKLNPKRPSRTTKPLAVVEAAKLELLDKQDGATSDPAGLSEAQVSLLKWQRRFLQVLRRVPNVRAACRACGRDSRTAYIHRKRNPQFAELWQQAIDASVSDLEARAFELALKGDSRETIELLQFMLRCHRPEIYKETSRREICGADGRPLAGIVFLPSKAEGPA
jgi:hypothetical protein